MTDPHPEGDRTSLDDAIGAAILASARSDEAMTSAVNGSGHPDSLALLRTTVAAEASVRTMLQQAVGAARSEGHSWAAIGTELAMTRQAAQQRFGQQPEALDLPPEERWLGPVTAFDEMRELEVAGRMGWRSVELGLMRHKMVRTATQWEHKRIWWTSLARHRPDGWEVAYRAFPWIYLVRDTGVAAEPSATLTEAPDAPSPR
ncbi:hypothetical protein [Nocardioides sp. AE5]|uniref:hypothetical protein n=1 Tax=Nocardioides sp. AE5 TaxID=2962573 RepID=UPI002881860A|nr:hypothetical protein [Nocardioides sp. AE5]MDT0200972.1 hypothetical protein [Nocardioides sp. AE5]